MSEALSPLSGIAEVVGAIERSADENRAISFLIEALRDTQSTIRAVDTKVGVLLAALAIPLPYAKVAFVALQRIGGPAHVVAFILGTLAAVAYVAAALTGVRALVGIGDASAHVTNEHRPDAVFYAAGLYNLTLADALFTRRGVSSRRSLEQYAASVPRAAEDVVEHLSFEMMTVAYVRDVKLFRQKIAFDLAVASLVLAVVALLL